MVGEVFPWGGNSVIFSVCASFSRTGVQLHEIDIWLDPRSLNKFYGALMFPKNKYHSDVTTPTSKMVKTTSPVDRVRVWARVSLGLVSNTVLLSSLFLKIVIKHQYCLNHGIFIIDILTLAALKGQKPYFLPCVSLKRLKTPVSLLFG